MTVSPPLWFRLPPGFHDVSPVDRTALTELAGALDSPEAQRELTALMDGLEQLAGHHVVHTALGLHPDESTGLCSSVFSLTVLPAASGSARLDAARIALAASQSSLLSSPVRRQVELPSGQPCYVVAGTISVLDSQEQLFQARIITPHSDAPHVVVLDLTSAAVHHAEAYTDILEAVALTVTFSDPAPAPPGPHPGTSRILEVLL